MKIIKRGTPPGDRIWKGICSTCGTEAECAESELNSYNTGNFRSGGPYAWEICPLCSEPNLLMKPKSKSEGFGSYMDR